jgi:hypothetical protein
MSLDLEAAIDAKREYSLKLSLKSSARACRHLKLRNPDECFGARAILFSDPDVEWVKVWLTVTFIKFRSEPVPWKYQNSPEMRKIAEINDLHGRRGMLNALRIIHGLFDLIGEQIIKLHVPRDGISYDRTRSEEYKEKRKLWSSNGKRKSKKKKYTKPQSLGLRSGSGQAHWTGIV